ncbi:MAG: 23S rRNA (adenine(2030)-N(6))-methyltransferase RlmJ [Alphaproteobacteria bacterium]|nr:23S rRNA (adenine(2030)-N(6))-methyltransferase RlmJ [Alphaproteobacteria bacterium]
MNYRHHFHAGSLADIVKHITLSHLLKRLCQKPAPYCVMDTHAAAGLYDLRAPDATKTGEADAGIFAYQKLPPHPAHAPFSDVLNAVGTNAYPGSPAIIQHYLREADKLIAIEKHPEEAVKLQSTLGHDPRIKIQTRDAWDAMRALIPTPEKRLLVFIDPPYEQPDENEQALKAIIAAYAKMSHAMFALWYPLKDAVETGVLQERFASSGIKKILRADVPFSNKTLPNKMNGSGMIIINPPYEIEAELRAAYDGLIPLCTEGTKPAIIDWLAGE